MKIINCSFSGIVFAFFLLTVVTQQAHAQSPWLHRTDDSQISIEWVKPSFDASLDDNDRITFLSSVLFVTARHPIGNRFWMLAELPVSHWQLKDGDGIDVQDPHSTIGNVYLGGEYYFSKGEESVSPFVEFGVRLPTMPAPDFPDKRGYVTGYSTGIDRREAFVYEFMALQGLGNLEYTVNEVLILRMRGGIVYWLYTGGAEGGENQYYVAQSLQAHFKTPELSGHFGLTGKYNVNESLFTRDDITQLTVGISREFKGWMGEFYLRTPLNSELYLSLRMAYGVVVNVEL